MVVATVSGLPRCVRSRCHARGEPKEHADVTVRGTRRRSFWQYAYTREVGNALAAPGLARLNRRR
jgi:hypothetical protein